MRRPTPHPTTRTGPGPARGLTLVEVVVVIALMTLVMVFVAPRLFAADALGAGQQAKMSAFGVLDAVTTMYAEDTTRRPVGRSRGPGRRRRVDSSRGRPGRRPTSGEAAAPARRARGDQGGHEGGQPRPHPHPHRGAARRRGGRGGADPDGYPCPRPSGPHPVTGGDRRVRSMPSRSPRTPKASSHPTRRARTGRSVSPCTPRASAAPATAPAGSRSAAWTPPAGAPVESYYLFDSALPSPRLRSATTRHPTRDRGSAHHPRTAGRQESRRPLPRLRCRDQAPRRQARPALRRPLRQGLDPGDRQGRPLTVRAAPAPRCRRSPTAGRSSSPRKLDRRPRPGR